jgi:hypothetical protein
MTIAQFGAGVFTAGQFAPGGLVLAQFGVAYSLIGQIGLYIHEGHGQLVRSVAQMLGLF